MSEQQPAENDVPEILGSLIRNVAERKRARDGVTVPRDALIHEEVADDVAACERAGRDWSGSGDFYLTRAVSPLAKFIDCPDCVAARVIPPEVGNR